MARDYAKVSARFWTGETGRRLRAMGSEVQLAALYLMTCPSSNMVGLYYLPVPVLAHETGLTFEGASKALRSLSDVGFALYDEEQEVVWVPEMARHQVGDELKPGDKQAKGVLRQAQGYSKCRFYEDFLGKYGEAFHLGNQKALRRTKGAPSKALRSQEQEQEQDQEQKDAAARACARDDSEGLDPGMAEAATPPPAVEVVPGSSCGPTGTAGPDEAPSGSSASSPTPAPVGHPAEGANPNDDVPLRPVMLLDLTELGPLAAELRWRLERRSEWKFLVAAPERKVDVRTALEAAVDAVGMDRAEALCWSVMERRRGQGLQPPKAMAFFLRMLEEAVQGGNPMPVEVPGVAIDQVGQQRDSEVEARWSPLIARMNPAQLEAYELEKQRLAAEVRGQGLWTTEEARQLDQAEQFLFSKWSARVAQVVA